jgi:hypothetical protein
MNIMRAAEAKAKAQEVSAVYEASRQEKVLEKILRAIEHGKFRLCLTDEEDTLLTPDNVWALKELGYEVHEGQYESDGFFYPTQEVTWL